MFSSHLRHAVVFLMFVAFSTNHLNACSGISCCCDAASAAGHQSCCSSSPETESCRSNKKNVPSCKSQRNAVTQECDCIQQPLKELRTTEDVNDRLRFQCVSPIGTLVSHPKISPVFSATKKSVRAYGVSQLNVLCVWLL